MIVLACTPRVGSRWIAETLLADAGYTIREYHGQSVDGPCDLDGWRSHVRPALDGIPGIPLVAVVDARAARWLYLQRRDRRLQARSVAVAVATGRWKNEPSDARPPVDEAAVSIYEARIERDHQRWLAFFSREALDYLPVFYEDVAADTDAQLDRMTNWIKGGTA